MDGLGQVGRLLVIVGSTTALAGGLLWVFAKLGFAGRLPGDIRIERPGTTCAIPVATSIILSIVLTVVLNVIVRFIRR